MRLALTQPDDRLAEADVDIVLELWAITVVTTVAGSFAAFLSKKS